MNKLTDPEEAVSRIQPGATLMVGGFGSPGTPFTLINELIRQGKNDLVIIKNEANEPGYGVSNLIEKGQVRKLVTSHLGLNKIAIDQMNRGILEVEFFPQGILAEKIRTGGAGLFGFLTDIGVDTELAEGKPVIEVEGVKTLVEKSLRADFALIHAAVSDLFGNLRYEATAMNFNPLMAMAADNVIAEAEKVVEIGALDPNFVQTTGAFVDHLVQLNELSQEYQIMPHHV